MPAGLDIALVVLIVAAAAIYIVARKLHLLKKSHRDWTTGHSESCSDCGLVRVRKEQLKAMNS